MNGVEGAGIGPADGPVADAGEAYRQMEAAFLRQMMSASGAFKPSDVAGGQIRSDMFIEALADAVSKGGGIGIARMLQDSMGDAGQGKDGKGRASVGGNRAAGVGANLGAALGAGDDLLSPELLAEAEAADRTPAKTAPTFSATPPKVITSGFGPRVDPIDSARGGSRFHQGIDLRAAAGDPIRAPEPGVVRRAGPRGGYGNAVEVDHGGGLTTLYAHASEVLVAPGEKVAAGQEIARVGQSGRATGPHLHFEVRVHDRQVDPTPYAGVVHRALNAYQQRAEDTVSGKSGTRGGDGP
jgi:murein DD-endopeptidase MepM/ murein hydrolase activator NlpD